MLNIYYLDDELELCENFQELFSTDKIKIFYFTQPNEIVEAIKKSIPDLVFLDFRLPNTNGDIVAKSLALNQPIFLITGDLHARFSYPFQKVFSKPYNCEEIQSVLNEFLEKKR